MEGKEVSDILLDTGCSRTMVQQDLVHKGKELEGEAVTICSAHGDVSLYPIAKVDLELEGVQMQVKAAMSNTLPVLVLDVLEMGRLLKSNPGTVRTTVGEALAVTTRAQAKNQEEAEARRAAHQEQHHTLSSRREPLSPRMPQRSLHTLLRGGS